MMALLWLAIVVCAAFAGLFTAVCVCARLPRVPEKADCIIVLGARVRADGSMSFSLESRCRRAAELYRQGMGRKLIVCGAQGRDEPVSEARAMKRDLVSRGVREADVLEEGESRSTLENLANARRLLQANGLRTALIVTSDYHVQRTRWLARDMGIRVSFAAAASLEDGRPHVRARIQESVSWVLYFMRKIAN